MQLFICCLSNHVINWEIPSTDCQPVSDARPRRLWSSDSLAWVLRRPYNTHSERCFAAAGTRVWNSLPADLRQSDSHGQYKRRLKSYFFWQWDHGVLGNFSPHGIASRRVYILPFNCYYITFTPSS